MTNLCRVTVAMLGLAIAGSFAITPSRADTIVIKRSRLVTPVQRTTVVVRPVVVPQATTYSTVVRRTSAYSTPYSVETRYGDVRVYEKAIISPTPQVIEWVE